jgi:hypothetical protein
MPLDAKWDQMLANNVGMMQDSLLAREDTFTRRRDISFQSFCGPDNPGSGAKP